MDKLRTYVKTHPWINFQYDLRQFSYHLWVMLGEAASKVEHIAGVPLLPEVAKEMHTLYLAKGALATTAIEGNTLTEEQAIDQIEGKLQLPLSREYLKTELENIVNTCNILKNSLSKQNEIAISLETIKWMNSQVLNDLPVSEGVEPGLFRQHSVFVGTYKCAPWADCQYLTDKLCDFLNNFPTQDDNKYVLAVIKSVMAHLYLVWIHPFADGNGRTARLLEFYILLQAGFPAPACHLLSNHYNMTRSEYYRMLDRASKTNSGVYDFIIYAVRGMLDGLREQIAFIREQQWRVLWINYIHRQFEGKTSESQRRRKSVVLALASKKKNEPVSIDQITSLSPKIAVKYAQKTSKTLQRDLRELREMELIIISKGKIQDNRDIILSFLPFRNPI